MDEGKGRGWAATRPGRWAPVASFAIVTMTLGSGFLLASRAWSIDPDGAAAGVAGPRSLIGADLLGCDFSEGWEDVADAIERLPEPPDWETTRRLLEDRGRASLRYSLRVRWWLSDGGYDLITYTGLPHGEPQRLGLFLEAIKHAGRGSVPDGEPIRSLDPRSRSPMETRSFLEMLVGVPPRAVE